jgi:CRP-like cAMP-binding protein
MHDRIHTSLAGLSICNTLTPTELAEIAGLFELQEIPSGEWIFREGEPANALFVVIDGKVEVLKIQDGVEHSLARLGNGAVLGEMALVTEENRSASVRVITRAEVLRLSRTRFQGLVRTNSVAALKMIAQIAGVLARRLTLMNEKTIELSRKLSGQRTEDLADFHRALQSWQL